MNRVKKHRKGHSVFPLIFLLPLLFLQLLLSGCRSEGPTVLRRFETAPLNGMVYDYENQPCSDMTVTLDNTWEIQTDINGRFIFPTVSSGPHRVKLAKKGFESLDVPFTFQSRTQVLYIKVVSLQTLIRWIEGAVREKNWEEAEALFERAGRIDQDRPTVRYLRAIVALNRGETEAAIVVLKAILENGFDDPVILLSIADIYQYRLGDPESARAYLDRYLKLKEDPAVRRRLDELR